MTAFAPTLMRPPLIVTGGVGLGVAAGAAIGAGHPLVAGGLLLTVTAMAIGLLDWRRSVLALLVFLPYVGIFTALLYPDTEPAVLAKDLLFVIPAYAGFVAAWGLRREPVSVPGAPSALIAVLAVIVVVQIVNPALPSPLVGLVGAKIWLFYIPLLYLGYHLINDAVGFRRVLKLMVLAAMIPAVIGIVEALLIYAGQANLVHAWYGDAAASVTQGFAELRVGSTELMRVPSTFPFVAQYYVFMCCMIAVAYAWWRTEPDRGARRFAAGALALFLVAVFLSGARGAFVFVPVLLVLILLLEPFSARLFARIASVGIGGLTAAMVVAGLSLGALLPHLAENATVQLDALVIDGFTNAEQFSAVGLGAGIDSSGARHVADPAELRAGFGGTWEESWWVKSLLELGVAGLVAVLAVLGTLLFRLLEGHYMIRRGPLGPASAALLAVLIWTLIYNVKAQYIDLDPLNVYFWLFAGLAFKIQAIGRRPQPEGSQDAQATA